MGAYEKLSEIQKAIRAPKSLWNNFGRYTYRSAEGILEALKPYLAEQKAAVTLSDEIIAIGGRVYVKATATMIDVESGLSDAVVVSAYAREPEDKKGMDVSQITGATSSYARKYALNGLLLLDDAKDPDTDECKREGDGRHEERLKEMRAYLSKHGISEKRLIQEYKLTGPESITEQYINIFMNPDNLGVFQRKCGDTDARNSKNT